MRINIIQQWLAYPLTAVCPITIDPITIDPITIDPITIDPITIDPITIDPITIGLKTPMFTETMGI